MTSFGASQKSVNRARTACINGQIYLGCTELVTICALAGRIVTVAECMEQIKLVSAQGERD